MRDTLGLYHISFVVEVEPEMTYMGHGQVGIDLGLNHVAVLYDGTTIGCRACAPRCLWREDRCAWQATPGVC